MVDYVVPGMIDSSAGALSNRNKIINGAMVIDQRNAGAAQNNLAAGWVYTVDRWEVYSQSSSRFSSQQNRGSVTPPTGFTNYLGLVVNTGYSVSAADYNLLQQPVEGFNIADLAWGSANARSVTLSFKVYSSLTGTHSGYVSVSALTTAYPFTFTVSSANTWTDISVTIAGPTTGTWPTNNTAGLVVGFNLGSGSNFQTASPNAWNSSAKIQPSSALSVVATTGATFYITGVQLERGSVATAFEYRNYQQELATCQRYWFQSETISFFYYAGSGQMHSQIEFPVKMRTVPTVTYYPTVADMYARTNAGYITKDGTGNVAASQVNSGIDTDASYHGSQGANCRVARTANAEL